MQVLLLGVGMQGKAALHDLTRSDMVTGIVAADLDLDALEAHVARARARAQARLERDRRSLSPPIRCEPVDGREPALLDRLFADRPDVAIDLLPGPLHVTVAEAAIRHGVHLVNASRAGADMHDLDAEARAEDVTILPEFGMDPGIDLVLMGRAVRSLERVEELISHGAGFPEAAAENPLRYKVTWTLEGVLRSYMRDARVLRDGRRVDIAAREIFDAAHTHEIEIAGVGRLEAFPNGDALAHLELLGLEPTVLRNLGRYVLRWPGHCAFWKQLVDLHLLDEEPVEVDGVLVDRRRFLAAALEPHLGYRDDERDVVVVRVEVVGTCAAKGSRSGTGAMASLEPHRERVVLQLVDRRDLETGHSAMSRTVGYTASIGAQMIGRGTITRRGVLSPVSDVPYEELVRELELRGMMITEERAGA